MYPFWDVWSYFSAKEESKKICIRYDLLYNQDNFKIYLGLFPKMRHQDVDAFQMFIWFVFESVSFFSEKIVTQNLMSEQESEVHASFGSSDQNTS